VLGGKSEHQRVGYFLTGSPGNGEIAPQKQTTQHLLWKSAKKVCQSRCWEKVKWWCKRLPGSGVNRNARKALSGAMPNRRA